MLKIKRKKDCNSLAICGLKAGEDTSLGEKFIDQKLKENGIRLQVSIE